MHAQSTHFCNWTPHKKVFCDFNKYTFLVVHQMHNFLKNIYSCNLACYTDLYYAMVFSIPANNEFVLSALSLFNLYVIFITVNPKKEPYVISVQSLIGSP